MEIQFIRFRVHVNFTLFGGEGRVRKKNNITSRYVALYISTTKAMGKSDKI